MTFLFYNYQLVRFDTFFFLSQNSHGIFSSFIGLCSFQQTIRVFSFYCYTAFFFKTVIVRYFFIGVLLCVFTKQSQYFLLLIGLFPGVFYKTVTVFLLIIGLLPVFFLQINQSIFTFLYGIVVILCFFTKSHIIVTFYRIVTLCF